MSTRARDNLDASGIQIGPTQTEYPFQALGDTVTAIHRRRRKATAYTPLTLGTTVDPVDPLAYLVAEGPPQRTDHGNVEWLRTYAHVPADQVEFSSLAITKPAFPSADFEGYWVDNTTSEGTVNVWGLAEGVVVSPYPSGGTFTITYKTSTTAALAYDASNATVQAAIEGLADFISDGNSVLDCTNNAGNIYLYLTTSADQVSVDATNLTPAHVTSETSGGGNTTYNHYVARTTINVNYPAHGQTGTFNIRYLNGTTGAGTVKAVDYLDANNFTYSNASSTAPLTFTHARLFVRTYTPGVDRVQTRRTSAFYLPGVTAGITTPADIPVPAVALNDLVLLLAVCENTSGFIDYDADALTRWLDGPIYTQTTIAILADSL